LVYRLVCLNGMIVNDAKIRAHHVGARANSTDAVYELLTDETLRADDHALLLKVRDVTRAAVSQITFDRFVEKLRGAHEQKIQVRPDKTVEVLAKKLAFSDTEHTSVLQHLISGGDLSKWGLINAVTRAAQDVPSYDRSTDLEAAGGRLLDLTRQEWKELALAA
jgi:hypothetical protein